MTMKMMNYDDDDDDNDDDDGGAGDDDYDGDDYDIDDYDGDNDGAGAMISYTSSSSLSGQEITFPHYLMSYYADSRISKQWSENEILFLLVYRCCTLFYLSSYPHCSFQPIPCLSLPVPCLSLPVPCLSLPVPCLSLSVFRLSVPNSALRLYPLSHLLFWHLALSTCAFTTTCEMHLTNCLMQEPRQIVQ